MNTLRQAQGERLRLNQKLKHYSISDAVRDELISCFDDVMDVLVHVDAENDEGLFEKSPLYRRDVQCLLDKNLIDARPFIEDFKIHYLDGQVEVEVILPFALSESVEQLAQLKTQSEQLKTDVKQINNLLIFLKFNNINFAR